MIYHKAPNQGPMLDEPRKSWGTLTRYMEIGDDHYAIRHVDVYENGYSLRYDRDHWVDGFGILADMRYNAKRWAKWWGPGVAIESTEFEGVWRVAESSPLWEQQVRTAKMSRYSATPVWLNRPRAGT